MLSVSIIGEKNKKGKKSWCFVFFPLKFLKVLQAFPRFLLIFLILFESDYQFSFSVILLCGSVVLIFFYFLTLSLFFVFIHFQSET